MRGWFPEVVQQYWRIAEYRTNSVVTWRGKPGWSADPSFILPKEDWATSNDAMASMDNESGEGHGMGWLTPKLKSHKREMMPSLLQVEGRVSCWFCGDFGVITQNMAKRQMGVFETVFAFWPGQKWTELYLQQMHHYTTGWWFQTLFIFISIWGNDPIWLIFFRWVGSTTN